MKLISVPIQDNVLYDVDVLCIPCDSVRFQTYGANLAGLELDAGQFISFADITGAHHAIKVANIAKIIVSPVKE